MSVQLVERHWVALSAVQCWCGSGRKAIIPLGRAASQGWRGQRQRTARTMLRWFARPEAWPEAWPHVGNSSAHCPTSRIELLKKSLEGLTPHLNPYRSIATEPGRAERLQRAKLSRVVAALRLVGAEPRLQGCIASRKRCSLRSAVSLAAPESWSHGGGTAGLRWAAAGGGQATAGHGRPPLHCTCIWPRPSLAAVAVQRRGPSWSAQCGCSRRLSRPRREHRGGETVPKYLDAGRLAA